MERLNVPLGRVPVIPVTWQDEKDKDKFVDWICGEIEQSIRDRKKFDEQCDDYWIQYLARRKRKDAGDDDSNLDVPLTMKIILQDTSRVINPIFPPGKRVFGCSRSSSGAKADAEVLEVAVNEITSRARANFKSMAIDDFKQGAVCGMTVVKVGFTREYETVLRQIPLDEWAMAMMADPELENRTVAAGEDGAVIEETIETVVGSFPEVINVKDYLWPWYATQKRGMKWEAHRSWMTPDDMEPYFRKGIWDTEVKEKLGKPDGSAPKRYTEAKDEGRSDVGRHHPVCEVYASYDVDGDGIPEEIISWIEFDKKIELKTVYNWMTEERRPFSYWSPERRDDGLPGFGFAFKLDPYQRARAALLNQRLDAGTRANEILLLVKKGSDILSKMKNSRLKGGIMETMADLEKDVREFKLSQPFNQLESMEKDIDAEAMQVGHLSYLNFGMSDTERPTKFGQQAQLSEGQFPLNMIVDSFSDHLAEIARMMLVRYAQIFPDGLDMLVEDLGPEKAMLLNQTLTWPTGTITGNIAIKTVVSSATLNAEIRKAERAELVQTLPNMLQVMKGLADEAVAASPTAPVAGKMLAIYTKTVQDYLESTVIGEEGAEQIDFSQEIQVGIGIVQMVEQMKQVITQGTAENQALQRALQKAAGVPAPVLPGQGADSVNAPPPTSSSAGIPQINQPGQVS